MAKKPRIERSGVFLYPVSRYLIPQTGIAAPVPTQMRIALAVAAIVAAVGVLYLPFASNPLVFDDAGLRATTDWLMGAHWPGARILPRLSFAFIDVATGSWEMQRLFNV